MFLTLKITFSLLENVKYIKYIFMSEEITRWILIIECTNICANIRNKIENEEITYA